MKEFVVPVQNNVVKTSRYIEIQIATEMDVKIPQARDNFTTQVHIENAIRPAHSTSSTPI